METLIQKTKQINKFTQANTQQLLLELKREYDQMRLDECHKILSKINKQEKLQQQDEKLISRIEKDYKDMIKAVQLLDMDSSTWPTTKIGNKKHSGTIANRVYSKSGIQAQIKGQFEVDGPCLISLVYEEDLFTEWVPFCCQSKLIHQVSANQKFVFVKFGFPYLSTRQIIFFGQAIDRFQHNGTLLINMRGVTNNKQFQKQYGVKLDVPGKKGVQFLSSNIVIEMNIKQPVYKFRTYSNVDLKVLYIPQFVVNFFAGKIGNFAFINVVDKANSLKNSEWQKRYKQDKNKVYTKLSEKLKQWSVPPHSLNSQ